MIKHWKYGMSFLHFHRMSLSPSAHLRLKGRVGGYVQVAFSTIRKKDQRNLNAYTDSFFTYGVWAVKKNDQEQVSTMNSLRIL